MKREIALVLIVTYFLIFGLLKSCQAVSPEKLYRKSNDKVVFVHVINKKGGNTCSGEFIDNDGSILTCAHCISKDAQKIFIRDSAGRVSKGYLVSLDKDADLALVDTKFTHTPYFRFGPNVVIGQVVYSFGSPLGIQDSMSVGHVANFTEKIYVVHSAFVNPGDSGGPLVDAWGRLVGVNEAMLMINPFQAAQGLFLALSVKDVKEFLHEY
jgi:S1-C subfamily serine protease